MYDYKADTQKEILQKELILFFSADLSSGVGSVFLNMVKRKPSQNSFYSWLKFKVKLVQKLDGLHIVSLRSGIETGKPKTEK